MHLKRLKLNIVSVLVLLVFFGLGVYVYLPKMFADTFYPLEYSNFIVKYSDKYGVDPALVAAVILQESKFDPNAKSRVGAQGLMQFMPGTAATMAKVTGRWPNYNVFDAETSIEFGTAHLRDLLIKYNDNIDLALYAYNNGTGSADRFIKSPSSIENYSYVRKVKKYQKVYATIYTPQLELEPIKIEQKAKNSEVRGFIWSQIFESFWDGLFSPSKT